MNYNKKIKLERIPRTAEAMQWNCDNTADIQEFLGAHQKTGEFRDHNGVQIIFVRNIEHSIEYTLYIGDWLLEGMDGKLRWYTDAKKKIMYQSISDELERLREFARFAIKHGATDLGLLSRAVQLGLLVPRECGLAFDLAESLRVPAGCVQLSEIHSCEVECD